VQSYANYRKDINGLFLARDVMHSAVYYTVVWCMLSHSSIVSNSKQLYNRTFYRPGSPFVIVFPQHLYTWLRNSNGVISDALEQWLKWFCEAGGLT